MIFKVDLQQEFHRDFHRDRQLVFLAKRFHEECE